MSHKYKDHRLLERIRRFFLQVPFAAAAQMHWKPSRTKIVMNKLFCSPDVFWSLNFQRARVWGRWGTSTFLTFLSSSPQSFLPFPSYLFKEVAFLPFQCHSCLLSLLHVSSGSRNYRSSGILAVPWYPSHGCKVQIFLALLWGKKQDFTAQEMNAQERSGPGCKKHVGFSLAGAV